MRLAFLYPPYRTLIRDWENFARSTIRIFYAHRARAADKRPFDLIVQELSSSSAEFRSWWGDGSVQGFDEGIKRLGHPKLGLIDLGYHALTPEGRQDLSLVIHIPRPGACDQQS